jgi:NAD(P)-dependent dehydrogenase (short-subunit alcohol dehydrogenase family)
MTQAILIVGGGLGIGLSTTLTILSSTPSSTKLIVFGLSADSSLDAHADRLWICEGDVTSAADRARAVELCVEKAGGIDTLLYCAGVLGPIQRIEKVDLEAVRRSFEVNFFGTVAMVRAVSSGTGSVR